MKILFLALLIACGCISEPPRAAEAPRPNAAANSAPIIEQIADAHPRRATDDDSCTERCPPTPKLRRVRRDETKTLARPIHDVQAQNAARLTEKGVTVSRGTHCDVPAEGTLNVIGFGAENTILVRFRRSKPDHKKPAAVADDDGSKRAGVTCPSRTSFFIDKLSYLTDTDSLAERKK